MMLKRLYKLPDGWVKQHNTRNVETGELVDSTKPAGVVLNVPPFDHVEVIHTGARAPQNFSIGYVDQALAEGWMTIGKGRLVLHAEPEDLVYRIDRAPGHYCCHCGEPIPDGGAWVIEGKLTKGQQHVAEQHPGLESPDPANSAGYLRLNHYACTLNEMQQAKYAVRPLGAPRG